MDATVPVDPATRRLDAGSEATLRAAFPDQFGQRISVAVENALRATALDVDEISVTLSTDVGWFAHMLLCGGGRIESVVARLRPSPVAV